MGCWGSVGSRVGRHVGESAGSGNLGIRAAAGLGKCRRWSWGCRRWLSPVCQESIGSNGIGHVRGSVGSGTWGKVALAVFGCLQFTLTYCNNVFLA